MEELQYISQYGILGFLGYFFIKEVFTLLASKKANGNGITKLDSKQDIDLAILKEVQKIQTNDLEHINKKLEQHSQNLEELKIGIAEIKIKLDELIK